MSKKLTFVLMRLAIGCVFANEQDVLTRGINEGLRLGGGIYLAESIEVVGSVPSPESKYWSGYAKLHVLETLVGQTRETLDIPYRYPVLPTDLKVAGFAEELYGFENVPLEHSKHKVLVIACPGPMRFGTNPDPEHKLGFSMLTNFAGTSDPTYLLAKSVARIYAGEMPPETTEDELFKLAKNANHDVLHFLDDPGTGVGQFTRFALEFAYLNLPPEGFEKLVNKLREQLSESQLQKLLGCAKINATKVLDVSSKYRGPFELDSKSTLEMRIRWMKSAMADWRAGVGVNGIATPSSADRTISTGQVLRPKEVANPNEVGTNEILMVGLGGIVIFIVLMICLNREPRKAAYKDQ